MIATNSRFGDGNPLGVTQQTPYVIPVLRLAAFDAVRDRRYLHDMEEIAGPGRGEGLKADLAERLRSLGVQE
jgi:hypothetical protein